MIGCAVESRQRRQGQYDEFSDGLKKELKSLAEAGLYFVAWIGMLVILKKLVLEQYHIQFDGLSVALVGALILSKVVLILEHVPLGASGRNRPAWVDVIPRTLLYSVGVLVVLLLEKGFEGRHEYGGFVPALRALSQHAEFYHVLANAICLSGALLVYNVLSVIRQNLGEGGLARMFRSPLPETSESMEAGE